MEIVAGDVAERILDIGSKAAMANVPDSDPLAANIRGFRAQFKKLAPYTKIATLSSVCADEIPLTHVAARPLGKKSARGQRPPRGA